MVADWPKWWWNVPGFPGGKNYFSEGKEAVELGSVVDRKRVKMVSP